MASLAIEGARVVHAEQVEAAVDHLKLRLGNVLAHHIPFGLYNGMINPIKTFTMKG